MAEIPQVTPLEQISPRGWVRYIFPFELEDGYDATHITDIIREGLLGTIRRFPTLGCHAVPDTNAKQANALKLEKLPEGGFDHVIMKDLRQSAEFQGTFAELKAKHFPVCAFPPDVFCRTTIWPTPGQLIPITMAQANFIPGGVILNWCQFHMVGDGQTFYTWTRVWAEECRRAQGIEITDPVVIPDDAYHARDRVLNPASPPEGKAGRLEDHPEYQVVTDPARQLAKIATTEGHVGQIFYFSKESLARLKKDSTPKAASDGSSPAFVSTNDALSALSWRSIMAAQFDPDELDGTETSIFNIATDGRSRMQPPVHPDALGSFLGFLQVERRIKDLLQTDDLAAIAASIRKGLVKMDKDFEGAYENDLIALANNQDDLGLLIPTSFLDVPGRNCAQSTWQKFKLYDLDWGHELGGRIKAIRSPSTSILNGMQIMLPELPDGGREMLIAIYESCRGKLLNDPIWMKYAEAR